MSNELYKIVQSHMYEIYSILAGTITLCIIYVIKPFIKRKNYLSVYENVKDEDKHNWELRKKYQRKNFIFIPMAIVIGIVVFWICSLISSQISFQIGSALMAGFIAIAEYSVIQQIMG